MARCVAVSPRATADARGENQAQQVRRRRARESCRLGQWPSRCPVVTSAIMPKSYRTWIRAGREGFKRCDSRRGKKPAPLSIFPALAYVITRSSNDRSARCLNGDIDQEMSRTRRRQSGAAAASRLTRGDTCGGQ